MIAKMLWPLIQVNLSLMFYINEIPTRHNNTKKCFLTLFYCDVTAFHQVPLTIVVFRHAISWETLRPNHPMCDVIIEQQLVKMLICNEVARCQPLSLRKKLFHTLSFMHFAFIFSECITIISYEEALEGCEHNFFQEI